MYLKKYLTEGLIQVAILLSLCGVRVDVDPYLPPLREIILGPTSALTQTQFHNLRNSLQGEDLHPKSVDLDGFFTTRRLLSWVRSLDRLQLPSTEVEAWLVHREPEPSSLGPMGPMPMPVSVSNQELEGDGGRNHGPGGDLSGLGLRIGGSGGVGGGGVEGLDIGNNDGVVGEPGYGQAAIISSNNTNNNLNNSSVQGAMGALYRRGEQQEDNGDIMKEDDEELSFLWRQEAGPDEYSEGPVYSNHRQHLEPLLRSYGDDEDGGDGLRADLWSAGGQYPGRLDPPLGANGQEPVASNMDTSLCLPECLQLLEEAFPFGQNTEHPDPELMGLDEDVSYSAQRPLLSPLLPPGDSSMDLEQQWQDLFAIMEPQDMDLDMDMDEAGQNLPLASVDNAASNGNDLFHGDPTPAEHPNNARDSLNNPFSPFSSPNDELHDPTNDVSDLVDSALLANILEEPDSSSATTPFGPLLEEAMFDEINLMDLALEEGFSPAQMCRLEEQLDDSDSGLSLDFSHSPASPASSEASCSSSGSSSSSASSLSSTGSLSEEEEEEEDDEGAVGYDHRYDSIKEEEEEEEIDAFGGGHVAETNKMCRSSYMEPSRFQRLPWLDDVSHDHNYNQPIPTTRRLSSEKSQKGCLDSSPSATEVTAVQDKYATRDERRARVMRIPFSNEIIVNLPVEEFNTLLTRHKLSEAQLTLIRDIRRRGKNKMAAQNCRRRKLDVVVGLEHNVEGLRHRRARLLREKAELCHSLREMKQRISALYQEVLPRLRDCEDLPYSDQEYSLQFTGDSRAVLSSHHHTNRNTNRNSRGSKPSKKQKDKRK